MEYKVCFISIVTNQSISVLRKFCVTNHICIVKNKLNWIISELWQSNVLHSFYATFTTYAQVAMVRSGGTLLSFITNLTSSFEDYFCYKKNFHLVMICSKLGDIWLETVLHYCSVCIIFSFFFSMFVLLFTSISIMHIACAFLFGIYHCGVDYGKENV